MLISPSKLRHTPLHGMRFIVILCTSVPSTNSFLLAPKSPFSKRLPGYFVQILFVDEDEHSQPQDIRTEFVPVLRWDHHAMWLGILIQELFFKALYIVPAAQLHNLLKWNTPYFGWQGMTYIPPSSPAQSAPHLACSPPLSP